MRNVLAKTSPSVVFFILATPAPSPFCPSPGQVQVFSPDQVAEGIQRLRQEEESAGAVGGYVGTSQVCVDSYFCIT